MIEERVVARREIQREIQSAAEVAPALDWAEEMIRRGLPAGPVVMILTRPRRTLEQNAKLWAMLRDIARQCELVINGVGVRASEEDWKEVFTAALRGEQRLAQGIDGRVVMLGARTSRMRVDELSELIELIYAYGSERNVNWSADSLAEMKETEQAA